jgi:general stress protein 26
MESEVLKKIIRDFLNAHRKGVFATVDEKGNPHTSLMLYVIDDELNLYFGTRKSFRKYAQLTAHPAVSVSVIEEALDPLRVVDFHGKAVELTPDEKLVWFEYFKSKNPSKYYVEDADDYVMFRVHPTFMRWLDATSGELTINQV